MSSVTRPGQVGFGLALAAVLLLGCDPAGWAQTNQTVYSDALQNGWQNWSWAAVNLNNPSPVQSGTRSISVTASNWQALYLHHSAQSGAVFTNLTFWIHGGAAGGQRVQVQATRNGSAQAPVALAPLPAGAWRLEVIPLTALGVATAPDFDGFWIQVQTSGLAPTFYVDEIMLVGVSNAPPSGTNPAVTITVNAALNRRPISPVIYGVAFASADQLQELNAPLNRWGGNTATRYNWQLNAANRGNDWYFQSIGYASATPGDEADRFIRATRTGGAQPILTIPMIDWMPRLGPGRSKLASYSIAKYGPQTDNDWQWMPDAGNGISVTNNTPITWNDPNDANFLTNSAFQQAWVRHLTNTWGLAIHGGVRYYCLDNEPALWHSTHRDVHPVGATLQEIRDKIFDYGAKVKAVDPQAQLLGPEEWGWPGYLYSGYDWQWAGRHSNWNPAFFPDRATNGGWDYGPWLLNQCRLYEQTNGTRLLDVFTLHIYPQGANQFSDDVSPATQAGRNRSTRALWDTNYVDESWIKSVIKLIPRMREWVATYYPGTQIGITEYNWGAENHINGATAQADLLGIFGREGLDLATRWTTPARGSPTFNAIKMYRNYDGNKSTFGDVSVAAGGPNPDELATFAAVRSSDGALTLMAINKVTNATLARIILTNFLPGSTVQAWQLTAANTITRLSDLALTGHAFTNLLPAQSITLFVIPASTPPTGVVVRIWDGDQGLPQWSWANNWDGNTLPLPGNALLFTGGSQTSTSNDLAAGFSYHSLRLNGDSWDLSGNAVTLQSGLVLTSFTAGATVRLPLTLATNQGFTNLPAAGFGGGRLTLGGPIALDTHTLTFVTGAPIAVTNQISGSGGLVKLGTNELSLYGSNSFTGPVLIHEGVVSIFNARSLGGSEGPTHVGSNATLQIVGGINSPENVFLGGTLACSAGSGRISGMLTMSNGARFNITGTAQVTIGPTAGNANAEKLGSGTLILTGNTHSHTGAVRVAAGRLQADGTCRGTSFCTTANPSNAVLSGVGTLGDVTLTNTSGPVTLAPGPITGGPARLIIGKLLNSFPSNVLALEFSGTNAATPDFDILEVRGTVTLGGMRLHLTLGFTPPVGARFVIVVNDGTDLITGTFAGLPQGAIFTVSNVTFQISYTGGSGNDVELTVVPRGFPSALTGVSPLTNSLLRLTATGMPAQAYALVATTNLKPPITWSPVVTNLADGSGIVEFILPDRTNHPARFYRLRSP